MRTADNNILCIDMVNTHCLVCFPTSYWKRVEIFFSFFSFLCTGHVMKDQVIKHFPHTGDDALCPLIKRDGWKKIMAGLYPKTEQIHREETWVESDVGVPPNGMVKAPVGSRPELWHLISLMHWAKSPLRCILDAAGLFQSVSEFKLHLTSCCTLTIH